MSDVKMRTTLTIEPVIAERLRREIELSRRTFKDVVNEALAIGLGLKPVMAKVRFEVQPHSSPFLPGIDPARLNQLVDELESAAFASGEKPSRPERPCPQP